MAGRGVVEPEDRVPHPRVQPLDRTDRWAPAVDPLHFDKPMAGVCLARTFGLELAERHPDVTVGLIPCAAGGSPISAWAPGQFWEQTQSRPYDEALRRTRRAMQDGVLMGILWHQGESDAEDGLAEIYEEKLQALIRRLRRDLDAPRVPFIAGQMGLFGERKSAWDLVDRSHATLPSNVPHTAFVPATGLTSLPDQVHFDGPSLREFGRRYAAACERLAADSAYQPVE